MIELIKAEFSYQSDFFLKNISIKVDSGQIIGLIGASGSGKSTILNLLSLKTPLHQGIIILNENDVTHMGHKLVPGHDKIKIVTQTNSLFPNISVAENILYELRFFNNDYSQKRLSYLLSLLKIKHLQSKKPRELSGGELQRVMIAKALADEPQVLLLDEPFSNLDVIIKKEILLELNHIIKSQQIACILVTHEIQDAMGLVDYIYILKNGSIIQKNTSEKLYFSPKNKYVAELFGAVFEIKANSPFYNNSNKRFQYIRPENIIASPEGVYQGKVIKSLFKGSHYEVIFSFYNQIMWLRSSLSIAENLTINFNII